MMAPFWMSEVVRLGGEQVALPLPAVCVRNEDDRVRIEMVVGRSEGEKDC